MKISVGNKVNLATQISNQMKQDIRRGIYKHGQYLPSMRQLSQQYGVSFNVTYRAIKKLECEGIVATHHGKGILVKEENPAEQSSILFGFIYPYPIEMPFERQILQAIEDAFSSRNNLVVTRSSKLSEENERTIATHFINNGVRGLIIFPVPEDKNGKFFAELARKVPVVIVDRLIEPMDDIPAVIFDTFNLGRDVCVEFFCQRKKKNLLVIVDSLNITPYEFLIDGIKAEAKALGKEANVKIIRVPISEMLLAYYRGDTEPLAKQVRKIRQILKQQNFDAIYCTQDEYIAYVLVDNGIYQSTSDLVFGTQINTSAATINLPRYIDVPVVTWIMDFPAFFAHSAELVQQSLLTGEKLKDIVRIKIPKAERRVMSSNYPAWAPIFAKKL